MNRLDSAGRPEAVGDAAPARQVVARRLSPAAQPATAPGSSVVHLADFQPDDESLIRLVLSGDTEQFAPLVRRYQERVRRFILKYEYNTHDAQDLAQETFLQAFRALPSFNHQARFSTWLTGIAFNLLRNHISRTPSKRHIHLDIDDQLDAASGVASHDPARDYENHQLLGAMERAVAALPQPMRDAIVLVASEGLSYEEAAQTLGVPIGTVKSRLCRARVQLADALRIHRQA